MNSDFSEYDLDAIIGPEKDTNSDGSMSDFELQEQPAVNPSNRRRQPVVEVQTTAPVLVTFVDTIWTQLENTSLELIEVEDVDLGDSLTPFGLFQFIGLPF